MRKLGLIIFLILTCWFAEDSARGADLRLPQNAIAGQPMTIGTSGSGEGTLYLIGPGQIIKRDVKLGSDVQIKGEDLHSAGRWIAILRGGEPKSQVFWIKAGAVDNLSFLARPSRVPVDRKGAISGTVFLFDKFHNLVLQPTPVNFNLSVNGSGATQTVTSHDGVAWIDASSARKEGAAQFVASVGSVSVRRVVQQVAGEPCSGSLRMHVAGKANESIVVETDPVRDCAGNPVPDGTIVTFIETDKSGKSAVDSRIKKGIAKAELPASSNATISVAAGVTLGNELHVGGGE
jgi:hypothetical protein